MTPVPEWRRVLRHAWSIRWAAATVLFGFGEALIPMLDVPQPVAFRVLFALLSSACGVGSIVSRLMIQRHLSGVKQ